MLHMIDTRITLARHANVLPGVLIPEEGIALVYVKQDGETYVQPSTGAAGEALLFAGVSMERYAPPRTLPLFVEYELTEAGTVQLPRVPQPGQIAIFEGANALSVTEGTEAPTTGANAVLNKDVLLFAPGEEAEGRVIRVQMLYTPTLDEARTIVGDAPFGGLASDVTGVVGRILDGEIATSLVDVSKDWTDVIRVGLGADGRFVPAAGANTVANVIVKNTPNAANPYLRLSILAA